MSFENTVDILSFVSAALVALIAYAALLAKGYNLTAALGLFASLFGFALYAVLYSPSQRVSLENLQPVLLYIFIPLFTGMFMLCLGLFFKRNDGVGHAYAAGAFCVISIFLRITPLYMLGAYLLIPACILAIMAIVIYR